MKFITNAVFLAITSMNNNMEIVVSALKTIINVNKITLISFILPESFFREEQEKRQDGTDHHQRADPSDHSHRAESPAEGRNHHYRR